MRRSPRYLKEFFSQENYNLSENPQRLEKELYQTFQHLRDFIPANRNHELYHGGEEIDSGGFSDPRMLEAIRNKLTHETFDPGRTEWDEEVSRGEVVDTIEDHLDQVLKYNPLDR